MGRTRSSAGRRSLAASLAIVAPLVGVLSAHAATAPSASDDSASAAADSSSGAAPIALAAEASATAATAPARGDGPRANWHPKYAVELEAHASLAAFDDYFVGFGGGARATFPIWSHAPFARIDDEIDVSLGFDIVYYPGFQPNPGDLSPITVRVTTYYFPVSIDWSIWLGSRANLFLGPAMLYRFGSYADRCELGAQCTDPNKFLPSGEIGLRFRIADHVALTIRATWPMLNIGASWL